MQRRVKSRSMHDFGTFFPVLGLTKRMLPRSGYFQRILQPNTFSNQKSPLYNGILFESTEIMHRPTSGSPLYFIIYSTFLRKNTMPAAGVCFPQPCSSAGRRFAPSRSRLDYFQTIGSFLQKTNWMKRFANWILLPVNTQVSSNRSCAGTLVLWSPKVHGSWNYLPYGTNGSR